MRCKESFKVTIVSNVVKNDEQNLDSNLFSDGTRLLSDVNFVVAIKQYYDSREVFHGTLYRDNK